MSNPVNTTNTASNQSRWRAGVLAAGLSVAAGITGYTAARLRHRPHRHTDTSPAGMPDNSHGLDIEVAGGRRGDRRRDVPQRRTPSDAESATEDLKRAVGRRPGLAIALTSAVVAVVTAVIVIFAVTPAPDDTMVADLSRGAPLPVLPAPTIQPPISVSDSVFAPAARRIPAAESGEACRDDCPGKAGLRFTLDFGEPWFVTHVEYRPLELVPGRRVTKLRWELHDAERTVFPHYEDSADGDGIFRAHLRSDGHRTRRITAIVEETEATVPEPDAAKATFMGRSPLAAYGYPAPGPDEEYRTRHPAEGGRRG